VVGAVFIQYWRVTDRHQPASHLARVKTGFWPSYCQISTNQVKFCTRLLLYGMHLWAGLDRDRRMGGSIRPNRNDCVFVILVTHPESYIETTHDGSPRFRWQTVRVEVRTGAVVKKFRNFVAWAELDPKSKNSIFRVFFRLSCAQPNSFTPNQWYRWKAETLKVCFLLVWRVCGQAFGKYRPLNGIGADTVLKLARAVARGLTAYYKALLK